MQKIAVALITIFGLSITTMALTGVEEIRGQLATIGQQLDEKSTDLNPNSARVIERKLTEVINILDGTREPRREMTNSYINVLLAIHSAVTNDQEKSEIITHAMMYSNHNLLIRQARACAAAEEWSSRAMCLVSYLDTLPSSFIRMTDQQTAGLLLNSCGKALSWESDSVCYDAGIDESRSSLLARLTAGCFYMDNFEAKTRCYRNALR